MGIEGLDLPGMLRLDGYIGNVPEIARAYELELEDYRRWLHYEGGHLQEGLLRFPRPFYGEGTMKYTIPAVRGAR